MQNGHDKITERPDLLWLAWAAVMLTASIASYEGPRKWLLVALAVGGLLGMGFGIWLGRSVARSYRRRDLR